MVLELTTTNARHETGVLAVQANAYRTDGPWTLRVAHGQRVTRQRSLISCQHWHDFALKSGADFERRFSGATPEWGAQLQRPGNLIDRLRSHGEST